MKRILIIEDDRDIAGLLSIHLKDMGFDVDRAADGKAGLEKALAGGYSLLVLYLMLPEMDGLDVCRRIRSFDRCIPILMLTAKTEESDKIFGFESGADDYITKPFGIGEVIARIKALLRRNEAIRGAAPTTQQRIFSFGELEIDLDKRKVQRSGSELKLTSTEFELLTFLSTMPGRPYTRQELLSSVWGYEFEGYEHTVNTHVNRLRSKIERDPSRPEYILTVWGVGYQFAEVA